MTALTTKTASKQVWRSIFVSLLALILSVGVWFGLPDLGAHARIAFITFGLAVLGWVLTDINATYIVLTAAIVFTVAGIDHPDRFFETLGDPMIWLLLASFIIAAAVTASGLSNRLTVVIATRVRSVNQLFFGLTSVILLTAFILPSSTGRAAMMVPIYSALSRSIRNKRIVKALALLFPTAILLSAVASLIGAGAHLAMADVLWHLGGERIGFARWMMLGLPFAFASCFASTWVILHLFLNRRERQQRLRLRPDRLATPGQKQRLPVKGSLSRKEWYVLGVVLALVLFWITEPYHGLNNTIIAILGAIAVTAPGFGAISFKDGIKGVNWNILLFMAASLKLGQALIESGGAEWLVQSLFNALQDSMAASAPFVISIVTVVSLLTHLVITSRTARASVLTPLVVLLGVSLGYNPTVLAFIAIAATGFCLTLLASAKPVAMFSELERSTYQQRDLLRLSSVLLPLHFGLLFVFALYVWPFMGLRPTREIRSTPPQAPAWHAQPPNPSLETRLIAGSPTPTPTPWAIAPAARALQPTTSLQLEHKAVVVDRLINYTLTITNDGPTSPVTATVVDRLSPAEELVSVNDTSCSSVSDGVITCRVGNVLTDTPYKLKLTTTVNNRYSGLITNTATVTGTNNIVNINHNNSAVAVSNVTLPFPLEANVAYVQSDGQVHGLGMVTSTRDLVDYNFNLPPRGAAAPAWSPDGTKIAFVGEPGINRLGGVFRAGEGIWVIDAEDGNPKQLRAMDHVKNLAWSPDGLKLAFEFGPPNKTHEIIVIDSVDGEQIGGFPGGEQPAWSPDSQHLVIKACLPDEEKSCGLWQVNLDGSEGRQITFEGTDSFPIWSPTGEELAFTSERDGDWEIYRLQLADSKLLRLTHRAGTDTTPVFGPSGQEIYFLRDNDDNSWSIMAIKADGSSEREIIKDVGPPGDDWGLARPAVHLK